MRITLVFLLVGCALAYPEGLRNGGQRKYKVADNNFLLKQKEILRLFQYVNQPYVYPDFNQIANNYKFNSGEFSRPEVVEQFISLRNEGLLSRGEIFSPFYEPLLQQAIALFRVFYYANNFDVFYKAAVWARNNVNEGLYVYALSVAIVQREDTFGIVLPPIYEVYPYYFYNNEVIEKAQRYKQFYGNQSSQQQYPEYIINANYSGWYLNLNPEQSLSYYYEDIGINAYYYYYNVYYPFWLGGDEFQLKNDRRGEQFYYINQQLLARYYLERLSNGFGEIPNIDYDNQISSGYYPTLSYPNGLPFPARPNNVFLQKQSDNDQSYFQSYNVSDTFEMIRDYERRIRDAIDGGIVFSKKGEVVNLYEQENIEVLANLIEGNQDSLFRRYYGGFLYYARRVFGYSFNPLSQYKVAPSALEQFETSLRDPVYYQFMKRVVNLFQKYKIYQGPYAYKDLYYSGVKIDSIQIDRLVTYFDYFYSDLNNAVYYNEQELQNNNFKIRARQYRLNHKPFNYIINVNSKISGDAIVRVYLGPKYDVYGRQLNISYNRLNFVEFDKFVYKLQPGQNSIERNSRQNCYVSDRTSFKELYSAVEAALNGQKEFQLDGSEAYYGYPNRYLLPKGKIGGQVYQFYVIINPYQPKGKAQENSNYYYPRVGSGNKYLDNRPLGYPFDKAIKESYFFVPNSYIQDVIIYNKNFDDINIQNY